MGTVYFGVCPETATGRPPPAVDVGYAVAQVDGELSGVEIARPTGASRPTGDFHSPEVGDPKLPFEVADRRAAQSAYAVHRRHLPVWETSWAAHDWAVGGSCDMIAMFHGAMGGEDDAS